MLLAALLVLASAGPAEAISNRAKQRKLTDTQTLFTKAMRWANSSRPGAWSTPRPARAPD